MRDARNFDWAYVARRLNLIGNCCLWWLSLFPMLFDPERLEWSIASMAAETRRIYEMNGVLPVFTDMCALYELSADLAKAGRFREALQAARAARKLANLLKPFS